MVKDSADAKKEVGMAQAQAMAMQAQANANLAQQLAAQRQLAGVAQAPVPMAPPAAPAKEGDEGDDEGDQQDGDDGAVSEQEQQAQAADNTRPAGVSGGASRPAPIIDAESQAQRKKADMEMFGKGAVLTAVGNLRRAVRDGKLDPRGAAAAILRGIDEIVKKKQKVPMLALWANGQLAEVIDAMLPDATMKFRESVIEEIVTIVKQAQAQVAAEQAASQAAEAS